jgi:hypothetical protein
MMYPHYTIEHLPNGKIRIGKWDGSTWNWIVVESVNE